MVRNRTYDELSRRLGPIDEIIAGIIARNGRASILEIGAGFGVVMHQIHLMFGERAELYGLNRRFHHGNHQLALQFGVQSDIFDAATAEFYKTQRPPNYLCADAGEGLPLAGESVDFVYSQASIPFVRDKANLIHEVNRILKPGGTANLQMNLNAGFMLGQTNSLFRIQRDATILTIEDLAGEVDGLSAMTSPAGVKYIKVEKRSRIPLDLSAVSFEPVGDPQCPYVESTYRLED